jgi:hypothetical protein
LKALFTLFLMTSLSLGWSQVINLEGDWKFHIDDRSTWSSPTYDDSKWETIYAPSAWEDQGFNGYDGFAWYRKKFDGRKLTAGESYQLALGFIDDCDEVFLNGKLIGFSGSMPPHFKTAYNTERQYLLPANLINFTGENLIAIRVFDVVHGGGIIDGRVGVYKMQKDKRMLVDLQGIWDFAKSENGEAVVEEKKWSNIMVPGPWEQQGFYKYDGFGWYRKSFTLPAGTKVDELILVLGKIDDFDKAYLNGQLIGTTNDRRPYGMSGSYEVLRAYDIPKEFIKSGPNTIEIRVLDLGNTGGIYEGPVGIMTRSSYERYYQE